MTGADRLPKQLRRALDRSAGECWFSPMSVWELGRLAARGRVKFGVPVRAWIEKSQEMYALREASVTNEVALAAGEIALPTQDPVDRFLAATAIVYGLTLMTVDDDLIGHDWLPTLSG